MSTKERILKGINYMKWGYTNYVALFLGIFNTILLVKGFFFSEISLWIILPAILIPFALVILAVGRWDFKKGLYPSASEIGIKNSPPARDSYHFFDVVLTNMINKGLVEKTEENEKLLESMRKWYQ